MAFIPHNNPSTHSLRKNKLALGETKWPGAQSLSPEDNRLTYTSTLRTMFTHTMFSALNKGLKMPNWRSGWSLPFTFSHGLVWETWSSHVDTNPLQTQMKGRKKQNHRELMES